VISNGWKFRPFHPKKSGHAAIKSTVIAAMRQDKVPGVVLSVRSSGGAKLGFTSSWGSLPLSFYFLSVFFFSAWV
jgi:hypothetical protein